MFITSKNKYLSNDMKIFRTCSIPLIYNYLLINNFGELHHMVPSITADIDTSPNLLETDEQFHADVLTPIVEDHIKLYWCKPIVPLTKELPVVQINRSTTHTCSAHCFTICFRQTLHTAYLQYTGKKF